MTDVKKFRKKPVVIEAVQYLGDARPILRWMARYEASFKWDATTGLGIYTLEGVMHVSEGDWVIRGVAGEFYPCRSDIFEQTYEAVDE